jgi:glycosyltransferase involved in cell wall biosynthesis
MASRPTSLTITLTCRYAFDADRTEGVIGSLRVLLSAFSCEPGKGSEPEVGLRALLAAAERHQVWVLTSTTGISDLQRFLAVHPFRHNVHLEAIPFGVDERGLGLASFHWHYDRWQRQAMRRAVELDRVVGFDIVHHVTMSTIWTRVGVSAVPKPLVWGPVGGGVEPPMHLLPELGLRGLLDDAIRVASRRTLAQLPPMRVAPATAAVILAQNRHIIRRLRTRAPVTILPNATAVDLNGIRPEGQRTREILLVGRIVAWKGGHLALRTLRHVTHSEAVLRVYGEGPDRRRLEQAARRWGISERVCFETWIRRSTLLPKIARAGVLLHPSFHDDAPLCVAEALTLGTPVVCLDHGGPAEVVQQWPMSPARLVAPAQAETTARQMAQAIDAFLADPPPVVAEPVRPAISFADAVSEAYEQAARTSIAR